MNPWVFARIDFVEVHYTMLHTKKSFFPFKSMLNQSNDT